MPDEIVQSEIYNITRPFSVLPQSGKEKNENTIITKHLAWSSERFSLFWKVLSLKHCLNSPLSIFVIYIQYLGEGLTKEENEAY
jgi:hypothetical protein